MITEAQLTELMDAQQLDGFIKHLKIEVNGEAAPFVLNEHQTPIAEIYDNRFSLIRTAPSSGITTILCAMVLHNAIWKQDSTVMMLYPGQKEVKAAMQCFKFMYEHLPDHFRPGLKEYNASSVYFDNGSRIIMRKATEISGCGLSMSLLVMDDLGSMKKARTLWTALQPTLAHNGRAIVTTSTDCDLFVDMWNGGWFTNINSFEG